MKTLRKTTASLLASIVILTNPAFADPQIVFRYSPKVVEVQGVAVGLLDIPDLYIGESFSTKASVSGGIGQITWSHEGDLPAGITFSSDGTLSGTPSRVGNFSGITFIATDETGEQSSASGISIPVYGQLAGGNLHDILDLDENTSLVIPATGGKAPLSFSLMSGSLPTGMSISGGNLTGRPSASSVYESTIRVTDANGRTGNVDVNLSVFSVLNATASFGDAYVDEAYSANFRATGGSKVYTWTADNLPDTLDLNVSTGAVTGTISSPGSVAVTGNVTDGYEFKSIGATINTFDLPNIAAKTFSDPYIGLPYTDGSSPSVSGGKAPLQFSATGLPSGLSINSASGAITGTPTVAGSTSAIISVTDPNGKTDSESYNFETRSSVNIAAKTYPDPYVGSAYTAAEGAAPTVSGGKAPFSWSATGLPAGMTINSATGVISGTPTSASATTAVVTVVDANGKPFSRNYAFTPRAELTVANNMPTPLKTATTMSHTISVTGGKAPYTFAYANIPTGLAHNVSTGVVSGKPTATGSFVTEITVTDANGKEKFIRRTIAVEPNEIAVSMAGGNGAITLKSLFSAADWASATPKVVNLASGQIRGSTSATDVVTVGGAWGGTLTFNVAGEIQGKAGAAGTSSAGGAGGNALSVETAGASGQKLLLNVTGAIRGGGGGGGKGGTGGTGGGGTGATTIREPSTGGKFALRTNTVGAFMYSHNDGWVTMYWDYKMDLTGVSIIVNTTAQTVSKDGWTYHKGALEYVNDYGQPLYQVYRTKAGTANTNGGAGGAGGNGGSGQGYNVARANGVAGVAGSAGGTSAGKGGTGATGGNGGAWGTAGTAGGKGATGANGNRTNGVAGANGGVLGAAGKAIVGSSNVTRSGSGTISGPTS